MADEELSDTFMANMSPELMRMMGMEVEESESPAAATGDKVPPK